MTTARHSATSTASISSAAAPCPTNQQLGEKLDTLTVKAMLAVPLTAVSSNAGYRFCPAPDCPTVYYRADGQQVFDETDVRERIYQKHADDPHGIICYCFGFTVGDVRAEYARGRANTIVEQIQNGVQAGQCACDIRNPQGRCCLGNVRNLIDRLMDPARNTEAHNV
jgi:Zinc binding domain